VKGGSAVSTISRVAALRFHGRSRKDPTVIDIRRILCPIDYSEFSRRALDHAVAIARWYGSSLR
jgi:hypothetical protein